MRPIQFFNPSSHSRIVSAKPDGTNSTYHLVAVAQQVPANPLVEFKYQQGTNNEVAIGIAQRVGTTDTFELEWSPGSLAEGSYTLKAILYNGVVEIGRDEVTVTVNNADNSPDSPTAETVEITYPKNGTGAGFFQPPSATVAHTVVNVTSSAALAPPSFSTGTATISVRYTKSPPGEEPVWIECATGSRASTGINSFRCALKTGDTPAMITGLAAVASPTGAQLVPGSGDAHRVFPYNQTPQSVTFDPVAQSGKPAGACSDVITGVVLDQNGQPIAGLNADVHAKGPTDNTRFDNTGGNSSAHQAPDKGHTAPEQAWSCENGAGGGTQGDHELAPGNPDVKHIETAATGTGNAGEFKFQLYSPTGPGTTDFALFADTDDDDLWCAEETSGRGSVGWTQSASPSPSPSGSASSSPSSSPSGSPGSTASPEPTELGPELASCPKGSASPSASPTGGGNRSISLAASKSKVVQSRPVRLSGKIASSNSACVDNELVEIERRIHGTDSFKTFKTTATDADGNYSVSTKPTRGADYQAIAPGAGSCDAAASTAAPVRVKPKVTLAASDTEAARGDTITLEGEVIPNHKGDKVTLQRKKGTRWVKVATDVLSRGSRYRFVQTVSWAERKFRVVFPKQDADHIKGVSRALTIRAT